MRAIERYRRKNKKNSVQIVVNRVANIVLTFVFDDIACLQRAAGWEQQARCFFPSDPWSRGSSGSGDGGGLRYCGIE